MANIKTEGFSTSSKFSTIKVLTLLSICIWITHFWYHSGFGFYEDDYTRIPISINLTADQLRSQIESSIFQFQEQGRPLHPSLIYLFSWLGWQISGIRGLYWIGFIILTLNAGFFYALLNRISNPSFALIGALLFCLYPADSTQPFLTHAYGIQPSLTFFLLASLAYLANKEWLAYGLIFFSLITYETIVPVFLAVPLLENDPENRRSKFLCNALVVGIMIVFMILLRSFIGETRVIELELKHAIPDFIFQISVGPLTSIFTYVFRPIQTLLNLNLQIGIMMVITLMIMLWALFQLLPTIFADSERQVELYKKRYFALTQIRYKFRMEIPEKLMDYGYLALVGLFMILLGYVLTFTVPPYSLSGRASRVHFATIVGASIFSGSICMIGIWIAGHFSRERNAIFLLAGYLTLLAGFGLHVQTEYVRSWMQQQSFWSALVQQIDDIDVGTVVLVQEDAFPEETKHIDANTWNLPRILPSIYQFPSEWRGAPPRVFRLKKDWETNILTQEKLFQINEFTVEGPPSLYQIVASDSVIFIEGRSGKLARRTDPLTIFGLEFPLKHLSEPIIPKLSKSVLEQLLITE